MEINNTQEINDMFSNHYAKEDSFQFDGILDFSSQFVKSRETPFGLGESSIKPLCILLAAALDVIC